MTKILDMQKQMSKRDHELNRKSKKELTRIIDRISVVRSNDRHQSKNSLITEIMTAEFGRWRLDLFYT